MPVQSVYSHTYKPFQLSPPSPDDPLPNKPHSVPLSVPAGLSSAKLGVTQEPPVGKKRKSEAHDRRVTFTTDYTEYGSPTKTDDKGLKFRAGYRRPDIRTPTVYQLEYTWPDPPPPPSEAPLLNAELMLHGAKHTHSNDQHPNSHEESGHYDISKPTSKQSKSGVHLSIPKDEPNGDVDVLNGNTHTQRSGEQQLRSKVKKETKNAKTGVKEERNKESIDRHARAEQAKRQIQDLLSQQSGSKDKSQSSKMTKKHRKKMIKQFVTEYQRQYGGWSLSNGKVKSKKKGPTTTIPAGVPRILTDSSDPRLLKHSPLPVNGEGPLLSNYQVNYVSPTDCDFVDGVWKGVSSTGHAQEKGSDHEEPIPTSHSWYNQLVELRHRAEMYKERAEGVNIRRLLPLTRRDVDTYQDVTPSTLSSDSISCTSSSPTPSDSVSCVASNDSARPKTPPKPAFTPSHVYRKPLNSASPHLHHEQSNKTNGMGINVQDIEDLSSETLSEITPHTKMPLQHVKVPSPSDSEGRVPTPKIQRSSSDFQRHHLDLTTPVDGGLFISPKKPLTDPVKVSLPFPPVSPKFRRDMKSRAPVAPPPQPKTKDECVQVNEDVLDSSLSSPAGSPPMENMPSYPVPSPRPSQHVPATSSPYHSKCVPGRKNKKSSGSIRKLDFCAHNTIPSGQTRSKNIPKLYTHRVEGNTSAHKDNCGVCGAHLNTPLTQLSKEVPMSHKPTSKPHSGTQTNGFSTHVTPTVDVPPCRQRPLSSTNYMTRLPAQWGAMDHSRDVDDVSLASLSLSSCSVASDVLKKARERREFWTQPTSVTAT